MLLKIQLDDQTASRLMETAAHELRPIHWQAEVMLRRALGTWEDPKPAPIVNEPKADDQVQE
jgi:hypothetical protein